MFRRSEKKKVDRPLSKSTGDEYVFVNGLNAKSGGGRSILVNFLKLLSAEHSTAKYTVLVPQREGYEEYETSQVRLKTIGRLLSIGALLPFVNRYYLPGLIVSSRANLLFNLSDVVVPTKVPQVFLFDWAYAVYPDSEVWRRMGSLEKFRRTLKLYLFRKYIDLPMTIIAQTETIRIRLEHIYGLSNIQVLPNAVSIDNLKKPSGRKLGLPDDRFKFLYMTHYYTHKNIEVLLDVAELALKADRPYVFVITISSCESNRARRLIREIELRGLESVVINLGPLEMVDVPEAYRQCDALIMPTLLESFSGTYVEAMFHQIPIFTSSYEFAIDVCGDAAFYFDPLDPESIFRSVETAMNSPSAIEEKTALASERLRAMPDWEQTYNNLQKILKTKL